MNIQAINKSLHQSSAQDIVQWALDLNKKTILTTNFGPHEAAIIHLTTSLQPDIPVVWIDSGYNTEATYRFAHSLIQDLKLNIFVYTPQWSKAYRDVVMNGVPDVDTAAHDEFTRQVKLEPFERAMKEFAPEVWLTAIRKDQTLHRASLDIVTRDEARGVLKVAPIFYWNLNQLESYLNNNNLPIENDYYDPTKVLGHRECGLHVTKLPPAK